MEVARSKKKTRTLDSHSYAMLHAHLRTHQWFALPPVPGASCWRIGGELTCPNGTSPHTWGTLYIYCLQIPTSPCCAQCVTGRYGYL